MPGSTIFLHIGGAGIRTGAAFWEALVAERAGTSQEGNTAGAVDEAAHFDEGRDGRLVPRAVFVDAEPGAADRVRGGAHGALYDPASFVAGTEGTNGLFATGRYTRTDVTDAAADQVRRLVERLDAFAHLHFTHATAGGAGSGFTSALMEILDDELFRYTPRGSITTTIVPDFGDTGHGRKWAGTDVTSALSTYNTVFIADRLVSNGKLSMVHVNAAEANHKLGNAIRASPAAAGYREQNDRLSRCLTAFEGLNRYASSSGEQRASVYKLVTNLVPFPRIKFIGVSSTTAAAALVDYDQQRQQHSADAANRSDAAGGSDAASAGHHQHLPRLDVALMSRLFDVRTWSVPASVTPEDLSGWSLTRMTYTSAIIARGEESYLVASTLARDDLLRRRKTLASTTPTFDDARRGPEWIPWNCVTASIAVSDHRDAVSAATSLDRASAVALHNSTQSWNAIGAAAKAFTALYRRRAFEHWYLAEGMDSMEFIEAESNLNDMSSEYEQFCGSCDDDMYEEFSDES